MKKIISTIVTVCMILITVGCSTGTSVSDTAINLIQDDIGNDITVDAVYYNKDQKGCVVVFSTKGTDDVACVHIDTEDVGYESVSEKLSGSALIDYPYDAIWVFNAKMNGSSKGWDKVR